MWFSIYLEIAFVSPVTRRPTTRGRGDRELAEIDARL